MLADGVVIGAEVGSGPAMVYCRVALVLGCVWCGMLPAWFVRWDSVCNGGGSRIGDGMIMFAYVLRMLRAVRDGNGRGVADGVFVRVSRCEE